MHSETNPPAFDRSRRFPVKGHRGVYYRVNSQGKRRYSIGYTDSDGRWRWHTVPGGLKDATAALADVRARLGKGERVAPTRQTFDDVAEAWLEQQAHLRPRTLEAYRWALRLHLHPRFGSRRIGDIREDDIALLIADMRRAGYAAWTIRGVLTPLGRILGYATRRGSITANPLPRLERSERPTADAREMSILDSDQIACLLASATGTWRPILATAVFSGLRVSELLGLTWADVDFDAGLIRVRHQLDRDRMRAPLKTRHATRDVVMMPGLARTLKAHRLASLHARESDLVFATATGSGHDRRNVARRGLEPALKAAGLTRAGRIRFHDLRHTFASLVISGGANVVFVSRQLGHASPAITLGIYAHLFDQAEHAETMRSGMEARFGQLLR